MPIKVSIVEDIREIRDGLALLINSSEGYVCEHTFSNPNDALKSLPNQQPDVVLMDIDLKSVYSGIDCIKQLKPKMPNTQFLICTIYDQNESIFESLKAGATGYILKKTPPNKLLEAITEIHEGGSPMSSLIARKIIGTFNDTPKVTESNIFDYQLSVREKEITEALSKGLRYKEIADLLYISTETVRSHIRNIYEKLQVHSRTDALNKLKSIT